MKKFLLFIILLTPAAAQATGDKDKVKDVTGELLNLGNTNNQSNQQQIGIKKGNDTIANQFRKMYGLKPKKGSNQQVTRGFETEVLDLVDLKKSDPKTAALLDILGSIAKDNEDKSGEADEKLDKINTNQQSWGGTAIRELTNTVRTLIQTCAVIAVFIIINYAK